MPLADVSNSISTERLITNTEVAEECFIRPNDFIPERWYSQPELIKERRAFAPFSLGMVHSFLILGT